MGLSHRADYLEVEPLKLAAKHFPLPGSLLEPIEDRYAAAATAASGAEALTRDALLAYLSSWEDLALAPLQSIQTQIEAVGEPGRPTATHAAILLWLGTAFSEWEKTFPLEAPMAAELQRLKPLAAKMALTDPDFLAPGEHPMHQLLDQLQEAAVGWQARLGRAGQACHRLVTGAVGDVLALQDTARPASALAKLNERVGTAIERDDARARRMSLRMIEAERGRIKTAKAKRMAALMINDALRRYPAPPAIGKFLKSSWYDSSQLVLLKFGADSEEWQQVTAATASLLDSVQASETEDKQRRQQLFEVVTHLPRQLKHWLLSLQHDSDAVDEAIGVVEFAHLKILRNQPLETEWIAPLDTGEEDNMSTAPELPEAIREGQWFALDLGAGEHLRARLALRMDDEKQLLFANQAGIKVLQRSFAEFAEMAHQSKVRLLRCVASFSRAMASAAGITTTEELDRVFGAEAARARQAIEQREREQAESIRQARLAEEQARRAEEAKQSSESQLQALKEMELPMGAWLGFHDTQPPLMAKLAVHDPEQNTYTFVDRNGIKLRQLSREELHALIDKGMIDILEKRSSFREQVSRRTQGSDAR